MTQQVSELDKQDIQTGVVMALISFILNLVMAMVFLNAIKAQTKENTKLTKMIRGFMKDGKPWTVYDFKEPTPNAFVIYGRSIFITTGLMKMMTEREAMAVILHEIGHLKNKDMMKGITAKSAMMGILVAIVSAVAGPAIILMDLWIFVFLGSQIFANIFVGRTLGRYQETAADSFATKHGYGDDLISALQKLQKVVDKIRAKAKKDAGGGKLYDLTEKLGDFLDEHPPMKKRVESILKKKETWAVAASKNFTRMRNYFMKAFGVKKPAR